MDILETVAIESPRGACAGSCGADNAGGTDGS